MASIEITLLHSYASYYPKGNFHIYAINIIPERGHLLKVNYAADID